MMILLSFFTGPEIYLLRPRELLALLIIKSMGSYQLVECITKCVKMNAITSLIKIAGLPVYLASKRARPLLAFLFEKNRRLTAINLISNTISLLASSVHLIASRTVPCRAVQTQLSSAT